MTSFRDLEAMALTVWGEARGEPMAGQVAVAHVIMNRVRDDGPRWPDSPYDVCHQSKQFSWWNNPEGPPKVQDPEFANIIAVCAGCIAGDFDDPTNGANHYLNLKVLDKVPTWYRADKIVALIGGHTFLKM